MIHVNPPILIRITVSQSDTASVPLAHGRQEASREVPSKSGKIKVIEEPVKGVSLLDSPTAVAVAALILWSLSAVDYFQFWKLYFQGYEQVGLYPVLNSAMWVSMFIGSAAILSKKSSGKPLLLVAVAYFLLNRVFSASNLIDLAGVACYLIVLVVTIRLKFDNE